MKIDSSMIMAADAFDFLTSLEPNSIDLIVSSPPYFIGKEYDTSLKVDDFISAHETIAPMLYNAIKPGGSICWQVGHHVSENISVPLDALVYMTFNKLENLYHRNRIIWTFGHGAHARRRFSGRHESILWFTKGKEYYFELDAARIPQKYPGKRSYKGPKKGQFSGNPRGKNPSDVWEIPNVKANHVEKTEHPCQFPVALAQRLVRALCPPDGCVVDPFMGSGTVAVAAALESRAFMGCDREPRYVKIAVDRLENLAKGRLRVRSLEQPIYQPSPGAAVANTPPHFSTSEQSSHYEEAN